MPDSELALVLLDGPDEAVAFPGVPGTWIPGRPIALADLGLSAEEARELAEGPLGLDLVEVEAGSAAAVRVNHAASSLSRRRGTDVEALPDEPEPGDDVADASPPADGPVAPERRARRAPQAADAPETETSTGADAPADTEGA